MINTRIGHIEEGKFVELITRVDERERPRQTVCVGVHWDYTLQELLELAEVKYNVAEVERFVRILTFLLLSIIHKSVWEPQCYHHCAGFWRRSLGNVEVAFQIYGICILPIDYIYSNAPLVAGITN